MRMKKQFLAVMAILCLLSPAAARAQGVTHFEHSTKTGTGTDLEKNAPENCARGQMLTFNGTKYACTDVIANPCPAGQFLNGVDAAGNPDCRNIYPPETRCPGTQLQYGQNPDGTPICRPRPAPQCRHIESGWSITQSVVQCPGDYPFLLTGGGHCARGGGQMAECQAAFGAFSLANGGFLYMNIPISGGIPDQSAPAGGYGAPTGWAAGCLPPTQLPGGIGIGGGRWCSKAWAVCCKNF
jgi:hypothetical protein